MSRDLKTGLFCALLAAAAPRAGAGDPQGAARLVEAIVAETEMAAPASAPVAVPPAPPPGAPSAPAAPKPYVVIFKGKSICDGCDTPFASYFAAKGYDVKDVGPGESTPELLARAAVYIVPGGDDVAALADGWSAADRRAIRDYVRGGGRYLGACLGGYWAAKAGAWREAPRGFEALEVLPAEALEPRRDDAKGRIVAIHWEGRPRLAYFQNGPSFRITDPARVLKIYATYDDNRRVAAFLSRYGQGKVAVAGVHVEATQDWYDEDRITAPPGLNQDLFEELVDDLFAPLAPPVAAGGGGARSG